MNLLWNGIEGIVIDAVGTLIDPDPSVAEAYVSAAQRQGVDLDPADVSLRFARHFHDDEVDDRLGPMVSSEPLEYHRWRRIVSAVLPEIADPDRGFNELWNHFADPASWFCYPDVSPALDVLRARGLAVLIASNFDARLRRVVAGLPGLAGSADAPVISSEVGYRKPHPAFYSVACARLGLHADRVLSVGDDPENDVLGARRAGLRAVLIDRKSRFMNGLPRVSGFAELVASRAGVGRRTGENRVTGR
jgi:putative hydrolase of the HAD superfamily